MLLRSSLLFIVIVIAVSLAPSIAQADDPTMVHYDVTGHTAAELRREIDAKGPVDEHGKRFDAHTEWNVAWTYHYEPNQNGCELTHIEVTIDGTIKMPHWTNRANAPTHLVKKWKRYMAALRHHEDGHYEHGIKAVKEIESLGKSFQVSGSCSSIESQFNRKASHIIEKYNRADVAYDRKTDHGLTQGTQFP